MLVDFFGIIAYAIIDFIETARGYRDRNKREDSWV